MKLFNFESFKKPKQEKPLTDQEIEKENIPIHEESGPIIKDREGLSLDQQDQTLIKEHLDLNDDGFEKTPSKENKFIPIENISDDDNKENNILDNIDIENINLEKIRKDIDGIENIKNVEIKNIIQKYILSDEQWEKLNQTEKLKMKTDLKEDLHYLVNNLKNTEINETTAPKSNKPKKWANIKTIRETKKMVRKDKKENTEAA